MLFRSPSKRGKQIAFFVEQKNTESNEAIRIGNADTLEDAIAIAKSVIDAYLKRNRNNFTSADGLYTKYQEMGPLLYIFEEHSLRVCNFDHLQYASLQCVKIYLKQRVSQPFPSLDFT